MLYIFNPQNDLALANGSPTFTAPTAALSLARDGACMPMLYGKDTGYFFGSVNADCFNSITEAFEIQVKPTLHYIEAEQVSPWGWSPQIYRFLIDAGFPIEALPTESLIDQWRLLSSRFLSAPQIGDIFDCLPFSSNEEKNLYKPYIAESYSSAIDYINRLKVAMIKLPWSNSGRGQQVSDRTTSEELSRRLSGMINRQKAVEITPFYNKIIDFAMLWENGDFVGYSLFTTDTHGGWVSNILMSDADIETKIESIVGEEIDFKNIILSITMKLKNYADKFEYKGPVGIDFIVAETHNKKAIIPIEINWRRTMGHVSHSLAENFLARNVHATFTIKPANSPDPYKKITDCKIENHRLTAGSIDLTPPGGVFRFLLATN